MQAKLVVVSGKASKRAVPLKLPTVIGRSKQAGLTVAHPLVSRRHCELFEQDGLLMLRDLGSLNGTTVAGRRIEEAAILPETEFTVGPLTFRAKYRFDGDLDAVPPIRYAPIDEDQPGEGPAEAVDADDFEYSFNDEAEEEPEQDEEPQFEAAEEPPEAAPPTPVPAPQPVPQQALQPTETSDEFNAAGVADFVAWAEAGGAAQGHPPQAMAPHPPAAGMPMAQHPAMMPSGPPMYPPPPGPYPPPVPPAAAEPPAEQSPASEPPPESADDGEFDDFLGNLH
jgi:predicted component of type VI protein secretion system